MKHGYNITGKRKPEYKAWDAMIQRCLNPNDARYARYGGRGITVCAQWRTFCNFIADLGDKPIDTSLGRKDNSGNYSCGKCEDCLSHGWAINARWETPFQQQNNTSRSHFIDFRGQRVTLAQAARMNGWPYEVIPGRLRIGWELERAVTVPWPAKKGALSKPKLFA